MSLYQSGHVNNLKKNDLPYSIIIISITSALFISIFRKGKENRDMGKIKNHGGCDICTHEACQLYGGRTSGKGGRD